MPEQVPELTQSELAALDLIIAEAEESGEDIIASPLVAPVAVAAAKLAARAFLAGAAAAAGRAFVTRFIGVPFPENVTPESPEFRQMEDRFLHEQVGTRPSLEDLKRIRDLVRKRS